MTMQQDITNKYRYSVLLPLMVLLLLVISGCDSGSQDAARPTPSFSPGGQLENTPEPVSTLEPTSAPTTAATAATTSTVAAGPNTFQNPVLRSDFPDPFILNADGTYYAYATNGAGKNVQLARSKDLVKWDLLTDAMPALPAWAQLGGSYVWAPEVIKIGDKYVLYYTARDKKSDKQCIGVAVADKPEGKYRDTRDAPLVCQAEEGGTIDASPFRDGGKLYLYFKNDGNCCSMDTYIYAQEMAPDGLSMVGTPTRLVKNDKAWEGRVVEAPTMWKQADKYYLFYSANNYAGVEYSIGYANCQSATGPCQDAPENPIVASRMTEMPLVVGPGHQTVIADSDGESWLVYHAWDVTAAGTRGSSRFMWMDKLELKDGKPMVNGPTTKPQPRP